MNQVLMNLLNNAIDAIDFKEPNGTSGQIIVKIRNSVDDVSISIKDNGHGMTELVKNKIFDPFFTTKDVGKGTGLGLSISYNIIKEHLGKIEVNSQENDGSEFIVQLPLGTDS